jgi:hypothetical protein
MQLANAVALSNTNAMNEAELRSSFLMADLRFLEFRAQTDASLNAVFALFSRL